MNPPGIPSIGRALTRELADIHSPARCFLDERFASGLRDVQRRYRAAAPPLVVPGALAAEANPGTVGTAADWLLRFLLYPRPALDLALAGAMAADGYERFPGDPGLADAMAQMAELAGVPAVGPGQPPGFTGPVPGSAAQPELLARACWALALLTEAFRSAQALFSGPLQRFQGIPVTAGDLLALAQPAGLDQLARFRRVFETALIPQLATRHGTWALGPTFAGSALIGGADADLIAAGLLLDLKTTSKKPSLAVTDLFQVIGYALLDFDDEYRLDAVGIFSARYAYLATWPLDTLLGELAGHEVSIPALREEFRLLLLARYSPPTRASAASPLRPLEA